MKKSIIAGLFVLVFAGLVFAGNSGISDPTVSITKRTNTDGPDRAAKELATFESFETAVEAVIDAVDSDVAQADTNATTTATAYTPTKVGQILVGGAGTGTNAVWVSKGTTTNDWVQVAP